MNPQPLRHDALSPLPHAQPSWIMLCQLLALLGQVSEPGYHAWFER